MTLSKTVKKMQFFLPFLLSSRVWPPSSLRRFRLCKMGVLLSEDSYCCCYSGLVPMLSVQEGNLSPLLLIKRIEHLYYPGRGWALRKHW